MKSKLALCISFSLLFIFSCGKSDETYTIEMKDGVKYVHNPAPLWGDEKKISLEFTRRLGDLENVDENYMFFKPKSLAIDNNGNFYVLDSGNFRVMKYDRDWNFVATFGRDGQGPGEFPNIPEYLDIRNNLIFVYEPRAMKLIVYNTDGKFLYDFKRGEIGSDVFGLLSTGELAKDRIRSTSLIAVYNLDGTKIREFGKPRIYENSKFNSMGNFFRMFIDKNDFIYITFDFQNRIEKYSPDGKLLYSISRKLPYKESTDREMVKIKFLSQGKLMEEPMIHVNIFSSGIHLDHKNRIWIVGKESQIFKLENGATGIGKPTLEMYDSEGVLLTHVSLEDISELQELHRIYDNHVYFIDTYNEMAVFEYKIVEK